MRLCCVCLLCRGARSCLLCLSGSGLAMCWFVCCGMHVFTLCVINCLLKFIICCCMQSKLANLKLLQYCDRIENSDDSRWGCCRLRRRPSQSKSLMSLMAGIACVIPKDKRTVEKLCYFMPVSCSSSLSMPVLNDRDFQLEVCSQHS